MLPSDRMSINDVERKLKEGLYSTKIKQGESDISTSLIILDYYTSYNRVKTHRSPIIIGHASSCMLTA